MRRALVVALAAALLAPAASARAEDLKVVSVTQMNSRLREYTLHTDALAEDTHVRVLLPDGYDPARRYPVLYLLHGCCDDWKSWTDKGEAEKITAGQPLIVVMPDAGQAGFYSDWYNAGAFGPPKWETYHIGQLIPWVDRTFSTDARREGRALAGLSMGGFGTMSYAARHPDMFIAATAFSPAVDNMETSSGEAESKLNLLDASAPDSVWGPRTTEAIRWRAHNPVDLAENLRGLLLEIRTGNGLPGGDYGGGPDAIEYSVHTQSINLDKRLTELKIPHLFEDYGPGAHDWPYWARDLRNSLPHIMRAFAAPPPPPPSVTFAAVEPRYSAYGWLVSIDRTALEFSRLEGATGAGFRLVGSGPAKVVTPPVYAPGSEHGVTAGTKQATLTADAEGRLTIPVDLGPAHTAQQDQPQGGPEPTFTKVPVSVAASPEPPAPLAAGAVRCSDLEPPRATARVRGNRLGGTARDRGCSGLGRIEVSVAVARGKRCRFLDARGRLGRPRRCGLRRYLVARGTSSWTLPVKLPKRGSLRVAVRATDLAGNVVRVLSTQQRRRA